MKIAAKIILILLSIPIFFLCILSINIRFQFLKYGFWTATLYKADAYSKVSLLLKDRLVEKVVAGGGKANDVSDLSVLFSAGNLKIFTESNIKSLLTYANGGSSELKVFIPLSNGNISKESDLKDFAATTREMSLGEFLKEFNVDSLKAEDFTPISKLGMLSWALTILSLFLLILIILLIYLLSTSGRRMIFLGIMFLIASFSTFSLYFLGRVSERFVIEKFIDDVNIGKSLAGIIVPPIIENIIYIWLWFAVSAAVFGVLLFFVKKPAINKTK